MSENNGGGPRPLPKADEARVRKIYQRMLDAHNECLADEEVPFIDAMMAVHNIHKTIVLDIASRQQTLSDRRRVLESARDTFVDAMNRPLRELV